MARRFSDIGLGTKQAVGFGFILLITIALGFFLITQVNALRKSVIDVTDLYLPRIIALNTISQDAVTLHLLQLEYLRAEDDGQRRSITLGMSVLVDGISAALDQYDSLRTTAEQRAIFIESDREYFGRFEERWDDYLSASFAFFGLVQADSTDAAQQVMGSEMTPAIQGVTEAIETLVQNTIRESDVAADEATATWEKTRTVTRIAVFAAVVLATLMAILLVRLTLVPVRRLRAAAQQIETGDLSASVAVNQRDEIGQLAISFNRMSDSLRRARDKEAEQAKALRAQYDELQATLSELRSTQEQLLLKEKMASLGDMVAGLAHEINNPIGSIIAANDTATRATSRVRELLDDNSLADETRSKLTRVLSVLADTQGITTTAGERIAKLIQSLKNFSRLDEAEYQVVDIHAGIESTLTLLANRIDSQILIEREFGDLPRIGAYPSLLNQVFLNVLKNAVTAITPPGSIRIRTTSVAEAVEIEISDTGIGIPPERLERIFDVGFTRSASRIKMGSGLSTAYAIMERHGGEIRLQSHPGAGTTVYLRLPVELRPTHSDRPAK